MKVQQDLLRRLLFEGKMIDSRSAAHVHSPFPWMMEAGVAEEFRHSSQVLDGLVRRMVSGRIWEEPRYSGWFERFEFDGVIRGTTVPLPPFFWTRFDGFVDACGQVFYTEFNYDKPCAQREHWVSGWLESSIPENTAFSGLFREALKECLENAGIHRPVRGVLLADPAHPEETRLAYLFRRWLRDDGVDLWPAGPGNLVADSHGVTAFGQPADLIIRLFPAEYLREVPQWEGVLEAAAAGKVLLLNDLRSVMAQHKSLFAVFWDMLMHSPERLTEEEAGVVQRCLPETRMLTEATLPEVLADREAWVIKPVLGRYSEYVYLGCQVPEAEWPEIVQTMAGSGRLFVMQRYRRPRPEPVWWYSGRGYTQLVATGNFGVTQMNGRYAGLCVRWSDDGLTRDESVWISPVGVRQTPAPEFRPMAGTIRPEELVFEAGWSQALTHGAPSWSREMLCMPGRQAELLLETSSAVLEVMMKTLQHVQRYPELMLPLLGIPDQLWPGVMKSSRLPVLLGRMDWVQDTRGNWRMLEINAETPAGLVEADRVTACLAEAAPGYFNPGRDFRTAAVRALDDRLKELGVHKEGRLASVSTLFPEDWEIAGWIRDRLRDMGYCCSREDMRALEVSAEHRLMAGGKLLDAVYRHYPLDWITRQPMIEALSGGSPSMNPPHTLVLQSKAFLALMHSLCQTGQFYSPEEHALILRHIPETTLSPDLLKSPFRVAKPLLAREGQGIGMNFCEPWWAPEGPAVFQEWVDTPPVMVQDAGGKRPPQWRWPVVGVMLAGSRGCGFYTRAGNRVTGRDSLFVPLVCPVT